MPFERVTAINLGNGSANDDRLDVPVNRLPDYGSSRLPRLHQMSFDDAVVSPGDSFHILQHLFSGH